MEDMPFDAGYADWYRAIVDSFPPLRSSASPLAVSEEDNLLNGSTNLGRSDDHGPLPLLPAYSSSASAMILREEDNYNLSTMFSAPATPASGDPYYFQGLPPLPAIDDALMLPFSDIDLDAFDGDAEEHKPAVVVAAGNMVIVPADSPYASGAQVARADGHAAVKTKHIAADGVGFDMAAAVVRHGGEHQHQANSVAALPPPPPVPRPQHQLRARSSGRSAAPLAGKTRLDHIGFEEIRKYFYMPITRAARELNVGLTVLKKRCRELGIARWPHRKMKSLRALILNVQKMGKGMSPAAVQQELAALETSCALMEEDPSIELTERTKKLRQACFKESYKRRRAASVNCNIIDHIYSFGHGDHQLALQETVSSSAGSSVGSSHPISY